MIKFILTIEHEPSHEHLEEVYTNEKLAEKRYLEHVKYLDEMGFGKITMNRNENSVSKFIKQHYG